MPFHLDQLWNVIKNYFVSIYNHTDTSRPPHTSITSRDRLKYSELVQSIFRHAFHHLQLARVPHLTRTSECDRQSGCLNLLPDLDRLHHALYASVISGARLKHSQLKQLSSIYAPRRFQLAYLGSHSCGICFRTRLSSSTT
jgi:hypothetical protein